MGLYKNKRFLVGPYPLEGTGSHLPTQLTADNLCLNNQSETCHPQVKGVECSRIIIIIIIIKGVLPNFKKIPTIKSF